MVSHHPGLRRRVGLVRLTLYGLGNILGAGIYVLVGKVAAVSGAYTALAFMLAAFGVAFTVFSYAELSARYPLSAGEALYVDKAFQRRLLSTVVGVLVLLSGISSSAAIAQGFAGYFQVFAEVDRGLLIIGLLVTLGTVAIWGIGESLSVVAVFTLLEASGLILVMIAGGNSIMNESGAPVVSSAEVPPITVVGIIMGAFLAFYAFVGFEDMVNIAEEVKDPARNLPRAALIALAVATVFYALVSAIAVKVVAANELAASDAPLALVYTRSTGGSPVIIAAISLCAVVNGALVQIIMGSRLLYGMAKQGWLPRGLARVSTVTATPVVAIVLVTAITLVMALTMNLTGLAEVTSFLVLSVFVLVNAALIRIKRRSVSAPGVYQYPAWIPWVGLVVSAVFIMARLLVAGG
ncbi:APC family permease [Spongiibacter marinus]|uniref:APC family permease n=1 Tax=Spongiibacter marinus TaxID=354246 RepID=UPI00055C845F|nr:amino acid permease [Spongiibacter marinus]